MKPLERYQKKYHKEKREHPTLPDWAVRQVVKDHLRRK
jgi:hypothetical protein